MCLFLLLCTTNLIIFKLTFFVDQLSTHGLDTLKWYAYWL